MFGSLLSGIGSRIGGAIGGQLGGGILSSIGRFAGKYLGGYLGGQLGRYIDQKSHKTEHFFHYDELKEYFHLASARYGAPIPLTFGKVRLAGKIIWSDEIRINQISEDSVKKFKQSPHKTKAINHHTEYEYYLSFAMALCEGQISEIARVWVGDELIDLSNYNFRLYNGSEDQMPDPLIKSKSENGLAPAFRGLAYIVFDDIPLADFNDTVPNFSFEVIRKANIQQDTTVEDLVKSMIMIPGSGEFVYDTIIQTKTIKSELGHILSKKPINSHNHFKIANSLHSLNQLENTCENIEWIAPVFCWFGTSIDIKDCKILPAIEFREDNVEYSEEWKVAGYRRDTALEISKDNGGNPNYGGSVNDASVLRYLEEMRKRGKKIMFYPMFLLDIPMKPWRGHLTGDAAKVPEFFHKKGGYNEFILHYANLVKNHVDAFIIGTELIGLTKIKGSETMSGIEFPAVNELIALARRVKQIVGPNILVSYAADWSEYHHTEGGWYNLDPLWASNDIDFIGIDAYFPATSSLSSAISDADLQKGWMSGEGYDYYIDENGNKQDLMPAYAWKNLRYWHENAHINPNGIKTPWIARSKKIWFTEYGFPSIDKASNQPNVFFDPLCSDGGVPKHSTGETNFAIQRKAIRAFIEYWETQEYIGQMFLWTWDARPYPAWPHMNIWRDGRLWEKGHWVNSKFGACSIAAIILEISKRCDMDLNMINVASVDECLEGVMINQQTSGLNAISNFRATHFFDIICKNDEILFLKRMAHHVACINNGDLITISENSYLKLTEIPKASMIGKIHIYFINYGMEYNNDHIRIDNEQETYRQDASIDLSILLDPEEAEAIGRLILQNARAEHSVIHFKLPITYLYLKPSDFILLRRVYNTNSSHLQEITIRIVDIAVSMKDLTLEITGIADDIAIYNNAINILPFSRSSYEELIDPEFVILDLPFPAQKFTSQIGNLPYIAIYLKSQTKKTLYYKRAETIYGDSNWHQLINLSPSYSICKMLEIKNSKHSNIFMIDNMSELYVIGRYLTKAINQDEKWHLALVGKEFIYFSKIEKIEGEDDGDSIYKITNMQRGQFGTEDYIYTHTIDEKFIVISSGYNLVPVAENNIIGQNLLFKLGMTSSDNQTQNFIFKNKSKILPKPYITQTELRENNSLLDISWVPRCFDNRFWRQNAKAPQYKYIVTISDDEGIKYTQEDIKTTNISINLSEMTLSGSYKLDIIQYNASLG